MTAREKRRVRRIRRQERDHESERRTMLISTVTMLSFASFFISVAKAAGFRGELATGSAVYSVGIGLTILAFALVCYGMFQGWSAITGPTRNMAVVSMLGIAAFVIPTWAFTQVGELMQTGYDVTPRHENPARVALPQTPGPMVTISEGELNPYMLITDDEVRLDSKPIFPPFEHGDSIVVESPSAMSDALVLLKQKLHGEVFLSPDSGRRLFIAVDKDLPYSQLEQHLQYVPTDWSVRLIVVNGQGGYGSMYLRRIPRQDAMWPVVHVAAAATSIDGREASNSELRDLAKTETPSGGIVVRIDDDASVQSAVDVLSLGNLIDARSYPMLELD